MPINARKSLNRLKDEVVHCKKCLDLVKTRKKPVPGTGASTGRIIIVGNYPSIEGAEKTGIPYTNDSPGKLLRNILQEIHLSLSKDTYITYLVKCTPRKTTIKDSQEKNIQVKLLKKHTNNCIYFLTKEISIITPHIIISLGLDTSNIILENFFSVGKKYSNMKKIHMRMFENPSFKLVPFYEPQDVTERKVVTEKKYLEDFKSLSKLLKVI
ncbi:MAG: hypothetical protein H8E13_03090 [Actinobacteria bacterium]|nr:hypothetical protein [Actinomycetota bacterium]